LNSSDILGCFKGFHL